HYHRIDLMSDLLDAALPADHRFAQRDEVVLSELAQDVFVAAAPGTSCYEVTLSACVAAGFNPDVRNYSTDWDAVAALIAVGCGVGLIPRLAQPLHRPGVVLKPLAGDGRPRAARNIFASVRAGAQADPVLAVALDALVEAATSHC
ncbi:MAG: LysR substrate-binding domain-containing protein, partial [Acidothermaceae bacterium]